MRSRKHVRRLSERSHTWTPSREADFMLNFGVILPNAIIILVCMFTAFNAETPADSHKYFVLSLIASALMAFAIFLREMNNDR